MGIEVIKSGGATVSAYLKLAGGVALSSSLVSVVDQADNVSPLQLATASAQFVAPLFLSVPAWTLGGSRSNFILTSTVASAAAGSNTYKMINNVYTINNTAAQTGTITGIFQNVTETALNGITHNLMDLQVGGVSKYKFDNLGTATFSGGLSLGTNLFIGGFQARLTANGSGIIALYDNAGTSFNRLQFGGTTSSFPALQRNTTSISFRLADDSGYCNARLKQLRFENASVINDINDGTITLSNNAQNDFNRLQLGGTTSSFPSIKRALNNVEVRNADDTFGAGLSVGGTLVASAILQADSTTKGFLMPRQTQAQILAILLPANGLQIYNTDLNQPCFFDGTAWRKISHSLM